MVVGVLITNPWFYAVAVPAVLLMGLSKSGFASGLGALATPLMALAVPAPQAAAIMLPLLFVMDWAGIQRLWQEWDAKLLRLLLPAGLLGTVVGTLLFGVMSERAVSTAVGGLTLLFLVQHLAFPVRDGVPRSSNRLGIVLGIASGFTSFVAHAGGPPISAYLLRMRLQPVVFSATTAAFFGAVNLSKWIPYGYLGLIDRKNLVTSLALMPLAPIGVWVGIFLARRIKPTWFYRFAYSGMLLTGGKLLWDGIH